MPLRLSFVCLLDDHKTPHCQQCTKINKFQCSKVIQFDRWLIILRIKMRLALPVSKLLRSFIYVARVLCDEKISFFKPFRPSHGCATNTIPSNIQASGGSRDCAQTYCLFGIITPNHVGAIHRYTFIIHGLAHDNMYLVCD